MTMLTYSSDKVKAFGSFNVAGSVSCQYVTNPYFPPLAKPALGVH